MIRGILTIRVTSCLLFTNTRGMATAAVDKNLLSKLRKRTGISFINCKKALQQFENDLEKAETWLKEQAQKEGWSKATKLQSRSMANGLVAVIADHESATMIEVNCETDFVARNDKFVSLTTSLARECHKNFAELSEPMVLLDKSVGNIISSDGRPLADLIAMEVGNVGENMALRRAVHVKCNNATLSTYMHSSGLEITSEADCKLGKYGVIVNLRQLEHPDIVHASILDVQHIGHLIGQHIVGMNPKTLGDPFQLKKLETAEDDDHKVGQKDAGANKDASDSESEGEAKEKREEERLLYQEFLLDPSMSVGRLLRDHGVIVNTFCRFECGEELPGDEKQD